MRSEYLQSFDRICILNPAGRADRRREVSRELRRQGITVDGHRVRFVDPVTPAALDKLPSDPAWGGFLSHLKTLRQARAEGVQRLLVLEDDLAFLDPLGEARRLVSALRQEPWHIAYFSPLQPPSAANLGSGLRWDPLSQTAIATQAYAVNGMALAVMISFLEACLSRPASSTDGGVLRLDRALALLHQARPDLRALVASQALVSRRQAGHGLSRATWWQGPVKAVRAANAVKAAWAAWASQREAGRPAEPGLAATGTVQRAVALAGKS